MFEVSSWLTKEVTTVAKDMLAKGKSIAPIESSPGRASLHVSTDKSKLIGAFLTLTIDGTEVHVGMLP